MNEEIKVNDYAKIVQIPVTKQTLFYNLAVNSVVKVEQIKDNVAVVKMIGDKKSYFHDLISIEKLTPEEYGLLEFGEDIIEGEIE